jgi:uncharacterized protein YqgC (DUF456 family)
METIATSSWFIPVLAVIMGIGLLSLLFYIIPGLTIIWLAILAYGIVTGFSLPSGILFAFITLLMIAGNLIDNLFMGAQRRKPAQAGCRWGRACSRSRWHLCIPSIRRIAFRGCGYFDREWIRKRDLNEGARSAGGILKGCGLAVFTRFGIGVLMIGLWVVWLIWL